MEWKRADPGEQRAVEAGSQKLGRTRARRSPRVEDQTEVGRRALDSEQCDESGERCGLRRVACLPQVLWWRWR